MTGMLLLGVAVLVAATYAARHHAAGHTPRPLVPVVDARAERELRSSYLAGQISIDVYLDRKYGTAYSSAGDRGRAG